MLLSHWRVGGLAALTGGHWTAPLSQPDVPLLGISTDSRTLRPGEGFLALRGERFDGHDHLNAAVEAGAGFLVIDRPEAAQSIPSSCPVLVVGDALRAYGDFAAGVRALAVAGGAQIIGVAGSSGKTTTKELLAAMLERQHGASAVLRSAANENNLIGVPKTLLGIDEAYHKVVVEAGMNQPGELARLAGILAPDTALLTNINLAHCGQFASEEAHFQAKLDWLRHVPKGTTVVVNSECPKSRRAAEEFAGRRRFVFVGRESKFSVAWAENIETGARGDYRFDLHLFGRRLSIETSLFGRYSVDNIVMAACGAALAEVEDEAIIEAVRAFAPVKMRGEVCELGGRRLIVDCYNAAEVAMTQALDSLADEAALAGSRSFALLADMAELGDRAPAVHRELGRHIAALGLTGLYVVGDLMLYTATEAHRAGMCEVHHFDDPAEATAALMEITGEGDRILLKGSRSQALERVLPIMHDWVGRETVPDPQADIRAAV